MSESNLPHNGGQIMRLKKWMLFLVLFGIFGCAFGQGVRVLELRAGYLNPKDTEGGLILGGSYGISIDERVDLSLGVSYFRKTYQETISVPDTTTAGNPYLPPENFEATRVEYATTLLPIFANVNIRFPIQPPLYWYIGGNVNYQFLFRRERNYEDDIEDSRSYGGFGWMARAGIEYTIGSRSSILIEAFYNSCKVKRTIDSIQANLPSVATVNMTGLGFRGGLRLEFY